MSGGNCGKDAAAAALSEAALKSGLIEKNAVGEWGTAKATVESALVGGVGATITGGSFVEGFSVAAAGYIFNQRAHPDSADAQATRALLVKYARLDVGDPNYTYESGALWFPNTDKCNLWLYDIGEDAGIDMPVMSANGLPIKAWTWASPWIEKPGFALVFDPQPGDIIASGLGRTAHVGIVVGYQQTASAAYAPDRGLDAVVINDWGFRNDLKSQIATYWRYVGH